MSLRKKPRTVNGHYVPAPRFTVWALFYFMLYVAGPLLAVCLFLDWILYLILGALFDVCYGVWCWV